MPLLSLRISPHYVVTLCICPDDNEKESPHGWIYQAFTSLPSLLPKLLQLSFWHLPVLHPIFVPLMSHFTTVGQVIRLINRLPQLRRLRFCNCKWKSPTQFYSGKQYKLTDLTVHNAAFKTDSDLLKWALTSQSISRLGAFGGRMSPNLYGDTCHILRTCRSALKEAEFMINDDASGGRATCSFEQLLT